MSHTDHSNRPGPSARGQTDRRTRDGRAVSPELQRQIDENLRRLYGQSTDETLPDQLQALIQRLRTRDDAR